MCRIPAIFRAGAHQTRDGCSHDDRARGVSLSSHNVERTRVHVSYMRSSYDVLPLPWEPRFVRRLRLRARVIHRGGWE